MGKPLSTVLAFILLLTGCATGREVMRLRSPDGRIDAVLIEQGHGAKADYEVRLVPVDPANGQEGRIFTIADVSTLGCPRPYGMRWSAEPGPAGTIQWVVLSFFDGGRAWLAVPPPSFRSGTVLARSSSGSAEDRDLCPQAGH